LLNVLAVQVPVCARIESSDVQRIHRVPLNVEFVAQLLRLVLLRLVPAPCVTAIHEENL
jgi:hypothetical protein